MRVLVMASSLLVACGALTPLRPDGGASGGGSAGGSVTGGGSAGGGNSVAGGTAGGSSGGMTAGGTAGGTSGGNSTAGGTAGGAVSFIWSGIGVTPAPTSAAPVAVAVAARPGDAWVVLDNGRFYRSDGGIFAEVAGVSLASVRDLYVSPSGRVYAVGTGRTALSCTGDCGVGSNFLQGQTASSLDTWSGLCGSGEDVFGFGTGSSSAGVLYQFVDGGWNKVSPNLGVTSPRSCQFGPAGEVYVAGSDGIARYENGGFTPEPIDFMGQPAANWNSLAFSIRGGTIRDAFAVGGGSGYRFARRNQQTSSWTSLPPNTAGTNLSVVITFGQDEFLAAGTPNGTGGPRFMTWNGSAWAPSSPQPPNSITNVRDAWATSDREVFLVGNDNASNYAIIRGRR